MSITRTLEIFGCRKCRQPALLVLCGFALALLCSVGLAEEPAAGKSGIRIALLPVVNQTKTGGGELSNKATLALLQSLSDRKEFVVVAQDEVQKAIQTLGLRGEISVEDQVKVGTLMNADRVARFTLALSTNPQNGQRMLTLYGTVIRVADGQVVARAYARSSPVKVSHAGSIVNVNDALRELSAEAVNQLVELATGLVGVVGSKLPGELVRISLGAKEGLRPGAEVEFFNDDNEPIGYGDCVEVDTGHSLFHVRPAASFSRILLDTHVRPIYNPPPYAAGLTVAQREESVERRDEVNFAIAVALGLAGVEVYRYYTR